MKKFKKVIAVALVGVMILGLTACGKFTCGLCQKEKSGKSYDVEGTKICKDCHDGLEAFENALGG